ncbi:MAG: hypothetical protein VW257_00150, partial [Quisquiliibacterium sp.]
MLGSPLLADLHRFLTYQPGARTPRALLLALALVCLAPPAASPALAETPAPAGKPGEGIVLK